MSRRNLVVESVLVTTVLFFLVSLVQTRALATPFGRTASSLFPLIWVLVPWAILTLQSASFLEFGCHVQDFPRSLVWGFLASLLLLIPYFAFFAVWFGAPPQGLLTWPKVMGWTQMALYQVFYIALPEEFYFRGYLQTRCNQILGRPYTFWGAPFGWGLFLAALIFTLFHFLIAVNVWTLGIFIPALIFGWLREKTASITASIVFHACSNIVLFTFQGNF